MWLLVGLGNPGRKYQNTRHNVGFMVVKELSGRWGIDPTSKKQLGAMVGDGSVKFQRCLTVQPQSFMNRSGQPVASLAGYFKTGVEQIVVMHDDLDLPYGTVRCKVGGGHGGHNGLRDISKHIGQEYLRVRVGIGRPPNGWDTADWVLGRWSTDEQQGLPTVLATASDAVESILSDGVVEAMNRFNVREVAFSG